MEPIFFNFCFSEKVDIWEKFKLDEMNRKMIELKPYGINFEEEPVVTDINLNGYLDSIKFPPLIKPQKEEYPEKPLLYSVPKKPQIIEIPNKEKEIPIPSKPFLSINHLSKKSFKNALFEENVKR